MQSTRLPMFFSLLLSTGLLLNGCGGVSTDSDITPPSNSDGSLKSGEASDDNLVSCEEETCITEEDTSLIINIAQQPAEKYIITHQPRHGVLGGTVTEQTYTPFPDYHGGDTFTYTADGTEHTIYIDVHPNNDAPSAEDKIYHVEPGASVDIELSGSDVDGDGLEYEVLYRHSDQGRFNGEGTAWTFSANDDATGTATLRYRAKDTSGALSNEAYITVIIDSAHSSFDMKPIDTDTTIDLGSKKQDVYLVLTNTETKSTEGTEVSHNARVARQANTASALAVAPQSRQTSAPSLRHSRKHRFFRALTKASSPLITKHERSANTATLPTRQAKAIGSSQTLQMEADTSSPTRASLRYRSAAIETRYGKRTLNVWVSDDAFRSQACSSNYCVTQRMVNQLALHFLRPGADNDIYDWDTAIYGAEWGAKAHEKYDNLIPATGEINILLTDIEGDAGYGNVLGYFYPKDNYTRSDISGSNEQIMFYIDSAMFAQKDGETWEITDRMPQEMLKTLAHEFQHMIHFYQKKILLEDISDGSATETWLDELMSETTEDVVATRMKNSGARNIDYRSGGAGIESNYGGRFPLYNYYYDRSMKSFWDAADYSRVSAFGTFLVRNYGGAQLLHDMMYNEHKDEQAITEAVQKTNQGAGKDFGDLLHEWGIATMLSDVIAPANTPTYNRGAYKKTTINGASFQLGSINMFLYGTSAGELGPKVSTEIPESIPAQSNVFYKVGTGLTGKVDINISLGENIQATLITKESK